jgi:predicted nuclease of predicted toxin-antitoxin system
VRLLLDAHISGSRVGEALTEQGHDVRSLDAEPENDGLDDGEVLGLAAVDSRVLITRDVGDFPPLLREWAAAGRSHPGVILIYGIGQDEFGIVVRGIQRLIESRPRQQDWIDLAVVLSRTASR